MNYISRNIFNFIDYELYTLNINYASGIIFKFINHELYFQSMNYFSILGNYSGELLFMWGNHFFWLEITFGNYFQF